MYFSFALNQRFPKLLYYYLIIEEEWQVYIESENQKNMILELDD